MIRCSHCGKLAPAGATSCQSCGMPLVSSNGATGARGAAPSEQSDLPAWLESLRANERPVANGGGVQPFSMAELVDENAMPSWMRQDQARLAEQSDAYPAMGSNARPASSPERQAFPANGLEAGSLIDEKSLPAWMREQGNGQPAVSGQSVSANSLVQRDALPAWMKTLDQAAPAQPQQSYGLQAPAQVQPQQSYGLQAPAQVQPQQAYGLPPQAPVTPPPTTNIPRTPQTPAAPLGRGFSAGELVDAQALPNWMTSGQGPGQQPQSRPVPTERGFVAGDLIDQGSLPNWMKDAQGKGNSDPVSAMGVPVTGSGQGTGQGILGGVGMPASTLLDMSAMPAWMREGEQAQSQNQSNMGFGLGSVPGTPQQPMAANSLIDMNDMPAWMRNADPMQQQQQQGNQRGVQPLPRAVPSRPRAEIVPPDQSEQAANIFASMLGVAASAPLLPGQQPQENNLGLPQQGQQKPQPPLAGWQSPQPPVTGQPMQQPQAWQFSGSLPRVAAAPPTGAPPSMPNTPGMGGPVSAQLPNVSWPAYASASDPNKANTGRSAAGGDSGRNGETRPAGTKKKGFFDAIREFISK